MIVEITNPYTKYTPRLRSRATTRPGRWIGAFYVMGRGGVLRVSFETKVPSLRTAWKWLGLWRA